MVVFFYNILTFIFIVLKSKIKTLKKQNSCEVFIMKKILNVKTSKGNYDIIISKESIFELMEFVNTYYYGKKIAFIVDENIDSLYKDYINKISNKLRRVFFYILKSGEKSKSLQEAEKIYEFLALNSIERTDLIISLGGGVTGDLTGFVASTYKRGVDYIQLPTTLLAQIDSSIGGKVAVNIPSGKNLVGSFYSPKLVLIDTNFHSSLYENHILDGLGEIIKYGFIYSKELFDLLIKDVSVENFIDYADDIVFKCCSIKKYFVEIDEFDKGERMKLNFGHSLGHGIEKYYGYGKYSHGQAVAMGIYMISKVFMDNNIIGKEIPYEAKRILQKYGMYKEEIVADYDKIIKFLENDKKFLNGKLNLIYTDEIGKSNIYRINRDEVKNFFGKGGNDI